MENRDMVTGDIQKGVALSIFLQYFNSIEQDILEIWYIV